MTTQMAAFDIDRFLSLSGAVVHQDLDLKEAARQGLSDGEARVLRYMADTETHTILYLRDLLAGHIAHDPEVTAFLSVWAYEELWHGRAIDTLLTACGHRPPDQAYLATCQAASWRETLEALLSHLAATTTTRFAAVHMAWGAVNELTAAAAYQALARRTANRPLATLLGRIAKQERKHFAFYYSQAERRLTDDRRAQTLCRLAMSALWTPVGSGVGHTANLAYIIAAYFDDVAGRQALAACDATMRRLPGMGWFNLVVRHTERLRERGRVAIKEQPAAA